MATEGGHADTDDEYIHDDDAYTTDKWVLVTVLLKTYLYNKTYKNNIIRKTLRSCFSVNI